MTRYGLVGAGMMGQEHMRNIALLANTAVTAYLEPDDEMAARAQATTPGAARCADLDALVARDDVDALVIASPNHTHVEVLHQIAARRTLPILCEKPLFTDPRDLGAVTAFAKSYAAPVWVAMEYRYMPPIAKFRELVDSSTGGIKMLSIREHRFPFLEKIGNWNRFNANSGGTLVEKCCHFFDLMRLILRDEPIRVMASAGQAVNHLDEQYDGQVPDIWDCGYVIVDFAGGARALLDLCMFAEGSEYQEEISAVGPAGKIEAKVPGPTRFWNFDIGPAPMPKVIVSPRSPTTGKVVHDCPVDKDLLTAGDHHGSTYYQHVRFLEVVRKGRTPEVTLADGAAAVRMGLAAQEAAITGQAVSLI